MHGTNKDETRRNKAREVGRKERKNEGERKRAGRRGRVGERERESRVGILWVGRRSPPQLSFDLRRPPELPPPAHARPTVILSTWRTLQRVEGALNRACSGARSHRW